MRASLIYHSASSMSTSRRSPTARKRADRVHLPRVRADPADRATPPSSPLASGGMGDVYRATDGLLGRTVAVKVLAERHARNPDVRARFTREARAAARLSAHPNVVTVFDVGEHDGQPFIVMEYLDGGSVLRSNPIHPGCPWPSDRMAPSGCRGSGRRARSRHRASRREAREPSAGRRGSRARDRLRHRVRGRPRHADPAGNGSGDGRVSLARAGSRRDGDGRRATGMRSVSSRTSCSPGGGRTPPRLR